VVPMEEGGRMGEEEGDGHLNPYVRSLLA
jgi:hypothetical protein